MGLGLGAGSGANANDVTALAEMIVEVISATVDDVSCSTAAAATLGASLCTAAPSYAILLWLVLSADIDGPLCEEALTSLQDNKIKRLLELRT